MDGTKIVSATLSMPLKNISSDYNIHRFDCDVAGTKFFLNDKIMHTATHNVPRAGGSLQLKVWADGNKWWSGLPSKTDVLLNARSIIAYYITTSSSNDKQWLQRCAQGKKQCEAVTSVERKKLIPIPCVGNCYTGNISYVTSSAAVNLGLPTTTASSRTSNNAHRNLGNRLLGAWFVVALFMVMR